MLTTPEPYIPYQFSSPNDLSKKFPVLTFVDRSSFKILQSKAFNFSEFPSVVSNYSKQHSAISKMSQMYLRHVNNEMYRILLGGSSFQPTEYAIGASSYSNTNDALTESEYNLLHQQFLDTLAAEYNPDCKCIGGCNQSEPLFEILPVDGENFIVIMENGFLHHVTSTKDNLEQFVLACLRSQYQFKSEKSLLIEMYLNLRLIPAFHSLISLRVR